MKLREIAYSRSGDKGDVSNICVFVDDPADYALLVDRLTAEIEDPAAVVAFAHRHFVRLAVAEPIFGALVIRLDASHGLMHQALGPRAQRDIQAGIDSGRFDVDDALGAVYITGGALLGAISGVVDGEVGDDFDQVHAEAVLRILGLSRAEARKVARLRMD